MDKNWGFGRFCSAPAPSEQGAETMGAKERFVEIYREKIKREGSEKLLDFLLSPGSDFFTAPASTRFHGAHEGGLCEHSLNVYDCLTDYLARPRVCSEYGLSCSEETVAVVALLHDICKINCFISSFNYSFIFTFR